MKTRDIIIIIGITILLAVAIGYSISNRVVSGPEAEIRSLVTEFGTKLRLVSLAAPSSTVFESIKDNYGPYISQGLLEGWEMAPERAPGKMTSSPWPDRIEIFAVDKDDEDGSYDVQGMVIEVTSADGAKAASQYAVALKIRNQDGKWVITGFTKALQS